MAYRDLLFAVLTYPDATPAAAIRAGAALARRLGGEVTALALAVDIPSLHNRLANALAGLDKLAEQEEARSAALAEQAARCFTAAAAETGLLATAIVERAPMHAEAERICAHARTRDLTLFPLGPAVLEDRALAEAALFGSGRPILVFPESGCVGDGEAFGKAAIAWDGSPRAARAVADALPALKRCEEVRILIVTGEKPTVAGGGALDLVRHLKTHGIDAQVDEVAAGGEPIGRVIETYVGERWIELLVMGGFGRPRAQEFVLGGATASVLEAPPCPVLLSH
ncbi:universal stress protein [Phenylobacterium sp.]|uniref:universal stress protein n=1 Tax=Phenylobacterium sp. TaxID=1871053 RepID=UPI0039194E69